MDLFILPYLFHIFSFCLIMAALFVISATNPVHSVLFLILVFCNAAGLLILLEVEFLAMIFLIVYVGAIAVLFLFVVMMLNIKLIELTDNLIFYLPIGLILALIFLFEIFLIIDTDLIPLFSLTFGDSLNYILWNSLAIENTISFTVLRLGALMYTDFFLLFLLAGFILFVAMIGAIMLTLYKNQNIKRQNITQQIARDFNKTIKMHYIKKTE